MRVEEAIGVAVSPQRIISLCAGIGGIELGIRIAGEVCGFETRTVCMVEREIYAAGVLAKEMEAGRLDPCPIWSDVKTFPKVSRRYRGKVHGITGGYPCQPFSAAGRRKGAEDPRHIFPDICRIIEAAQPLWCFFENVSGHLSLGFDEVHRSLRGLGYAVEAGLYEAAEVGASHRRQRLFILAYSDQRGWDGRAAPRPLLERSAVLQDQSGVSNSMRSKAGRCSECLADAESYGVQRHGAGREQELSAPIQEGLSGCLLPAFPPGPADPAWADIIRERPDLAPAVEFPVRGMADELPVWTQRVNSNRVDRLRALGNAVVPACAAVAFIDLWRKVT